MYGLFTYIRWKMATFKGKWRSVNIPVPWSIIWVEWTCRASAILTHQGPRPGCYAPNSDHPRSNSQNFQQDKEEAWKPTLDFILLDPNVSPFVFTPVNPAGLIDEGAYENQGLVKHLYFWEVLYFGGVRVVHVCACQKKLTAGMLFCISFTRW